MTYTGKERWKNQREKRRIASNDYHRERYASDPVFREKVRMRAMQHRNEKPEMARVADERKYNRKKGDIAEGRENLKRQCADYLGGKCAHCGFDHIAALCFHHRNPNEKSFGVTEMVGRRADFSVLKPELDKCDLLCANCHMIEHYEHDYKHIPSITITVEKEDGATTQLTMKI